VKQALVREIMSTDFLRKFGVSPTTGFLPEDLPLQKLCGQFDAWENIVADLPALILAGQIRDRIDSLPILDVGKLHNVREQHRAYSVLGFLIHAYVWSPPEPRDHLPKSLADPMLVLAEKLGIPPLATYACLCLWNFRTLSAVDPSEWDLSNLATIQTFTGATDESWFYLLSVALERFGGPCLANGVGALFACRSGDIDDIIVKLERMTGDIDKLTELLMRMPQNLDPHFFYHRLRPYLAGSKGMESAGLPKGVRYGDEEKYRQYSGGSNGQSSLIQAIDIILNVDHNAPGHRQPPMPVSKQHDIKETGSSKPKNAFLKEMRNYMPREHRHFLEELESQAILRPFILKNAKSYPNLAKAYDDCLIALREFRSKHIQIVMRYISLQSRAQTKGVGLSSSNGQTGTGGTDLMPFLKQTRDEVSDVAVGDWNKNILSSRNY